MTMRRTRTLPVAAFLWLTICFLSEAFAPLLSLQRQRPVQVLFSNDNKETPPALLPSEGADDSVQILSEEASASATAFMVTREQRRVLIEELGYTRKQVDSLRVDIVGQLVQKGVKCPAEGLPAAWVADVSKNEISQGEMLKRLESESKYPLKTPLLGVSLVLFGKGLSDAIVTLIKVNMEFNGVSLADQFMGVNILAIDAVCVLAGAALGVWTWKTMRDD